MAADAGSNSMQHKTHEPQTLEQLPTPCFLLYQNKLEANCRIMAERAKALGVKLRPHVKTHKTHEAHEILRSIAADIIQGCVASTMSVSYCSMLQREQPRQAALTTNAHFFRRLSSSPSMASLI